MIGGTYAEPIRQAGASIDRLTFSDGTQVDIPVGALVVIIGSNNSGKSQALRDIYASANSSGTSRPCIVVPETSWKTHGDGEGLERYLEAGRRISRADGAKQVQVGRNHSSDLASLLAQWSEPRSGARCAPFVMYADTEQRLTASHPVIASSGYQNSFSDPLQRLSASRDAQDELASVAERAFARPVFVDRWTGRSEWSLKAGTRPSLTDGGLSEDEYRRVEALPLLRHEGDGIRSFVGILLEWKSSNHTVVLVDEPEAFLHPPQALMLGQELARLAEIEGRQLVASTHSRDMLLGLLSGRQAAVVIRLNREGDVNHVSQLTRTQVEELWSDPLLRQSNIFDGLFSQRVVLCESNADCAYYSEILAARPLPSTGSALPSSAPTFRHADGKDRLPLVAKALRAAGVPLSVIVDIDIFETEHALVRLVESVGGDFATLAPQLKVLADSLRSGEVPVLVGEARDALLPILARSASSEVTDVDRDNVKAALRPTTRWRRFAKEGVTHLQDAGLSEAESACRELLIACEAMGIFVVPYGALESWAPHLQVPKRRWFASAVEAGVSSSPRFSEALDFVMRASGIAPVLARPTEP